MAMILVVAAREDVSRGSDDAAGPEAKAQSAEGAVYGVWCRVLRRGFMQIGAICSFAVAGIALFCWHKWMTVLKIIELGSLED